MALRMISTDLLLIDAPGYLVVGDKYQVGRSKKCAFVVNDRSVSRAHAEVTAKVDSVLIQDLDSTNGTYVDGIRLERATEVTPGQAIRFGRVLFELTLDAHPVVSGEDSSAVTAKAVVNHTNATGAFPALKMLGDAQRRVLDLLMTGLSEKEVARHLKISQNTVHNHVKAIYKIMGVNSRPELLALFVSYSKEPKT